MSATPATVATPRATARFAAHGPTHAERLLVGSATVAMALIAGFFYAYACSVMIGLARADDRTFIVSMQSINATVRNAAFAPSFFGALVVTAAAAVLLAARRRSEALPWVLAAGTLYAGAFVVTMAFSVPLNDQLANAGAVDQIGDLAGVRSAYEGPWVRWNVVRTVLSTAAVVALVRGLLGLGRAGRGGGALNADNASE